MKLFHLSDLHLGKRVNEISMIDDQRYILAEILRMAEEEKPDAVLIAGDVYDKPLPPVEAVTLFDDFLFALSTRGMQVFVISGNHDAPERIAFGWRLMAAGGVHLAPLYSGHVEPVTLTDEYGAVQIYMLPFVKPAAVRRFFPEREIVSYTDAVAAAIAEMDIQPQVRNILLTHQFVAGACRCESEELSVGGTDAVSAEVLLPFDYVALGHLHTPQSCTAAHIRYSGTPLKYSFSEAEDEKSVTVVTLCEKGNVEVRTLPLIPARDLRCLRGSYESLMDRCTYIGTTLPEDYLKITLTDEEDIPDAAARLRTVYPNLMKLEYDNSRTRAAGDLPELQATEERSPLALFSELYEIQNGREMSEEQRTYMEKLIETVWEEIL